MEKIDVGAKFKNFLFFLCKLVLLLKKMRCTIIILFQGLSLLNFIIPGKNKTYSVK